MSNDTLKNILTFTGIIILIIISFKYLIPLLLHLIIILFKIIIWVAIVYVLYLFAEYLYGYFSKNNS